MSDTTRADRSQFAEDVEYYLSLSPRQLPSQYLYDDLGSALFEAIGRLPWYRITRTEHELLGAHASEILARIGALTTLVELGPGHGTKLANLIDAARMHRALTVHLVDVSPTALQAARRLLSVHAELVVVPHQAAYEIGLAEATRTGTGGQRLTLFLGSNIGNFDPPGADAFLRNIRGALSAGDWLLLGADLIKAERELLLAYDDPLGVTAAFNRNLLVRANRELGADFDVAGFTHRASWNADVSRIEMHLVSSRTQRVRVPAAQLDITFDPGETIWTESSYKYRPDVIVSMLDRAGFDVRDQWEADGFALTLAQAAHV